MRQHLLNYLSFFVAVGAFAIGVDAYVIGGLLPKIAQSVHVSVSVVGLLISVYMLCYGLFSPLLATLLSQFKVKLILGVALIVFIAANFLSAFSPSFSYLIISRIIAGLGAGLYMPFALSVILSFAPEHQKGRYLGRVFGGMAAGTITGVPIGLLMAIHLGWQASFLFVALLGVIALFAQLFVLPDMRVKAPPTLMERVKIVKNKKVLSVVSVSALCAMGGLSIYAYLPLILKSFHISPHAIVIDLFVWGVGGLLGAFINGRVLDFFKNPFLMVSTMIGLILMCVLFIPIIPTLESFTFLILFIWGLCGWGLQVPQQFLLNKFGSDHGAIVISLALSMRYLGIALGTALMSLLLSQGLEPRYVPFVAAISILSALMIHLFVVCKDHVYSKGYVFKR